MGLVISPPQPLSPAARAARAGVRLYQWGVSPLLAALGGPGSGCRFEPSCSRYMIGALEQHGFTRGTWIGLRRICRCHPWGGHGFDPVPGKGAS
jgi:putative membrane protein insertion efficiency factor